MTKNEMIVAGVMSGTSADGINVALVRVGETEISSSRQKPGPVTEVREAERYLKLLGHAEYRYPKPVRQAVLAAMNAPRASVADLARLNFLLGELYADAVLAIEKEFRLKVDLVGCHGQTLYHQGDPKRFLGHNVAATWQTGEAAVLAARVRVPVVSDFRPADIAAGGKGAPLVSFLDYMLFHHASRARIVQNIGGIANLTFIPAGSAATAVVAFDTGPGNMVIDAVCDRLFAQPFDRAGRIAKSGRVIDRVVNEMLRGSYFRLQPPKTAGREEFGREFVGEFVQKCGNARKQDIVATATALTARSIADAIRRFVLPRPSPVRKQAVLEMILSGGGAKNATLVAMLKIELAPLGVQLRFSDNYGLPSEAKEAVAFALLAYETWHRRASNVPSATGANRVAVLGKISFP
jgi:anhydro-N-acetylmuramic acid kinase